MKKLFVIALALALTAGAAYANYCARDYVPAASLLVPYAAVDMDATGLAPDVNGYTTILSVTNVSSEAQLIHITVWSPLSNAIVDWDEVLTGYDVWMINFRDLLTGHFDYFDTGDYLLPDPVNNWGPTCGQYSMPDAEDIDEGIFDPFDCAFPYGYNPTYGAGIVGALKTDIFAVTAQDPWCGKPGTLQPANPPWLSAIVDDPLFFYVTVDNVNFCNQFFPNGPSYWQDNPRVLRGDNVLIGEVAYVNSTDNFSEAMPAVHLEWDWDVYWHNYNTVGNAGTYPTFYSLDVGDVDGAAGDVDPFHRDGLEPLATAFGFRYYNTQGISTSLLVWKSREEITGTKADATLPYIYFAWDMDEQTKARTTGPSGFDRPEPNVIPWETQEAPLNAANWNGLLSGDGWMLLVFDPSIPVATPYEAWVGVRYKWGGYSAALEAATMANANCFRDQTLPYGLGINYDYDAYYWD